jgi:hypothetical protein
MEINKSVKYISYYTLRSELYNILMVNLFLILVGRVMSVDISIYDI